MKKNKIKLPITNNRQPITLRKAFTLIELLVVATIIVILTVIVVLNLEKARAKSRDAQRKADLSKIASALEMYKVDHKTYIPFGVGVTAFATANSSSLALLLDDGAGANYIQSIPTDPTSTGDYKYQYKSDDIGANFKLKALSETIKRPTGTQICNSITADAISKAGDFYNPYITGTTECTYFQISSSKAVLNGW